ncbi:PRD domain-containing protein [Paratractidigestivibacter sp.]|uniref:PRD domain-containing protein n=1 Tax=Paratractidigestivibacter sp. TaxID=2847316 RepID=UPI002ABDE55F|nr:PRD domain-containing protein [Paratractidigestivibacter sp.]
MLITKRINNNVAMAEDADGNELVVFGKGLGFRKPPYELEETSQIHRVFRHVNEDLLKSINSISGEVIGVSMDIVRLAEIELDCKLNPNLYLTLADHLQFAAERFAEGVVIENPLAADIPLAYPVEYELGKTGLAFMDGACGVRLPETEACSIALHITSAEGCGSSKARSLYDVQKTLTIIGDVTAIVEKKMCHGRPIERRSHSYVRFVTHLKFLVKRLMDGGEKLNAELDLIMDIAKNYPTANATSKAIARYFKQEHGWKLTDEERFYLLMYLISMSPEKEQVF